MGDIITSIGNELAAIFRPDSFGEMVASWVVKLASGLLVFVIFYLLWMVIRLALKSVLKRGGQDKTTRLFILNLVKYTVLIIGGVNALKAGGVDIAAVLASLGIAGITVGFAARDAFSNLISGLLIFLDRPFVIGDLVEVGDNYGRVDAITLRSTRIVTPDGRMLAVPNAEMINKTVASYTNFPNIRLDIQVTVDVNENLDRARKLLLSLVEGDPRFLSDPAPAVLVQQLNDYNVLLELRAWLKDERTHIDERARLREKVFNTLTEAGVAMPYETIRLTPLDVNIPQG